MVMEKLKVQQVLDKTKRKVQEKQKGITTFFDNVILQEGNNLLEGNLLHESEHTVLKRAIYTLSNSENERFIKIDNRISNMSVSDLDGYARICSQGTNSAMQWKGKPLFKSVYDLAIYQMMINDIRPSTIIEIGSTESSLFWLKDMVELHNLSTRIIGIDHLEPENIPEGVDFKKGDIQYISNLLSYDVIKNLPKPFLIIEDAHVYLPTVLDCLDDIMSEEDYLVLEDSLLKQKSILQWAETKGVKYYIDTKYTDFFGINCTTATNSILIKRGTIK